eukprot:Phypoly_transcript_23964.p1 GENE.Phypoly_transcript_23964~~Phypoly_transcript_23964.p1  ORF type:complete len:117 (-),score=28.11 Phypoly_transcript_23964:97-447(-)
MGRERSCPAQPEKRKNMTKIAHPHIFSPFVDFVAPNWLSALPPLSKLIKKVHKAQRKVSEESARSEPILKVPATLGSEKPKATKPKAKKTESEKKRKRKSKSGKSESEESQRMIEK